MFSTWVRGNTSLLCRCMTRPLLMQRFYGARPSFCHLSYRFAHPESRRTMPEVYINPLLGRMEELKPDINSRNADRIVYRRSLMQHPLQEDNRCFNDKFRWAEFRRKMIHGFYTF